MRTTKSKSGTQKKVTEKAKASPPAKSKGGRPAIEFSPTERITVMLYKALGLTDEQIAQQFTMILGKPVSSRTLRARCNDELENGQHRLNAQVAGRLFTTATQGQDLKAANTAGIFWMKAMAGLKEGSAVTAQVEVPGDDPNKPQKVTFTLKMED